MDTDELERLGCFIPNCEITSWIVAQEETEVVGVGVHDNVAVLYFTLQKSMRARVYKHFLNYQFSNFVADFGGYLGLMLGASLITIYDSAVDFLGKLIDNICYKKSSSTK